TVALPGERPQMPQRVAGRPEAQCGELTLHGLGPERERLGVIGGDRVEERTVEELLVQSPDPAAYGPEFGAEGSGRIVTRGGPDERGAGEPAVYLRVLLGWQQVRAIVSLELAPVIELAEILVRGEQVRTVITDDVSATTELPVQG